MDCQYTSGKKIGRGGYSSASLVKDSKGKAWAMKIPTRVEPLEVDILCRLEHPNLLHAHDLVYSECGVEMGYILPLSPGNLYTLMNKINFPLSKLMKEVGSGLEFLHSQGITHGDLRLHNILVYEDKFVVGDFGMAQYQVRRYLVGPEAYIAPETFMRGLKGKSIDVWLFGILCLEYALKKDWDLHLDDSVEEQILSNVPRQLASRIKDPSLKSIVMDCLNLDPRKRPTMKEVCKKLKVKLTGYIYHEKLRYTFDPSFLIDHAKKKYGEADARVLFLAIYLGHRIKVSNFKLMKLAGDILANTSVNPSNIKGLNGILLDDQTYESCRNVSDLRRAFAAIQKGNYPIILKGTGRRTSKQITIDEM